MGTLRHVNAVVTITQQRENGMKYLPNTSALRCDEKMGVSSLGSSGDGRADRTHLLQVCRM